MTYGARDAAAVPAGTDDPRPAISRLPADRSRLHWLLVIPVIISLALPLYNRTEPELIGIPFYYWFQMLMVLPAILLPAVINGLVSRGRR